MFKRFETFILKGIETFLILHVFDVKNTILIVFTYWMTNIIPYFSHIGCETFVVIVNILDVKLLFDFQILDVLIALAVPEAAAQMPAHGLYLFLCIYSEATLVMEIHQVTIQNKPETYKMEPCGAVSVIDTKS